MMSLSGSENVSEYIHGASKKLGILFDNVAPSRGERMTEHTEEKINTSLLN